MESKTRTYLLSKEITDIYIAESPDNLDNVTIYATGGSDPEEGVNNCSFPNIQLIVRNKSVEECIRIANLIKRTLHNATRDDIRAILYSDGSEWDLISEWTTWGFWDNNLEDPSILLGWRLKGNIISLGRDKNNRWIRSINFSIIRNGV